MSAVLKDWLQQLWRYRILAIVGGMALAVPLLLMNFVSPRDIQDVWLPNTYLPLMVSVWLVSVIWGIWVCADVRRGVLLSLGVSLLFWWRLLGLLTPTSIGVVVGILVVQEVLFQLGDWRLAQMVQSRSASRRTDQISHHRHSIH